MEKWLVLLSVIPEPIRFIVLVFVALSISWFFGKILAALTAKIFKPYLLQSWEGPHLAHWIVRAVFWTSLWGGTVGTLYCYYSNSFG